MSTLNVTVVQADLHWHDPDRNLGHFGKLLASHETSTDLFVLPEMFSTGFTMDAKPHAERMDGRAVGWMAKTAASLDAAICGSLIIEDGGHYYNRFIFTHPDGHLQHYDKRHLFRLADEHSHYSPGHTLMTIEYRGWRIRPMVCYDLRFPVWSRSRQDYDLLVYVANWPDRRHLAWETLARARAIENLAFVAAVNRTGVDGNDHRYAGGSALIDYLGNYLQKLGDEPALASASLDLEKLGEFRERFRFHEDADRFSIETDPA